jgi:3-keto-5-aminohexanoate cleavage enzyme
MDKLIINFTPTGMIPTKQMTPYVPVTPQEIVEDVRQAYELGITMVHLHARDNMEIPTYDSKIYAEIILKIRKFAPDLIICVSTSGRNFPEYWQRSEVLKLKGDAKPDMASLTLSSLNFNKTASMNSPDTIKQLAKCMSREKIKPELEVFDLGMINYAKYLYKKGLIEPPFYFNLILGNIACAQANPLSVGLMLNELPEQSIWSIGGIGETQLIMNSAAIIYGGGVRIGLEDNIWYDKDRTKLATNISLIKRIHKIANALERPIMTPIEARKVLNI